MPEIQSNFKNEIDVLDLLDKKSEKAEFDEEEILEPIIKIK